MLSHQNKLPRAALPLYPGKIERSLCEKDAFTERGVICFHKAISHWKPINGNVQESEFSDLAVPFGLKMYPSMIDVRDIHQWRGGLVSHGYTEENKALGGGIPAMCYCRTPNSAWGNAPSSATLFVWKKGESPGGAEGIKGCSPTP